MRSIKLALGLTCALMVLIAAVGVCRKAAPNASTGSTKLQAAPSADSQSGEEQLNPQRIIAALERSGFKDGLDGRGWHKSNYDGIWNAVLRKGSDRDEVSVLLESKTKANIERIELEADLQSEGLSDEQVISNFRIAIGVVFPDAPVNLHDAIANRVNWRNESWELAITAIKPGLINVRLSRCESYASRSVNNE